MRRLSIKVADFFSEKKKIESPRFDTTIIKVCNSDISDKDVLEFKNILREIERMIEECEFMLWSIKMNSKENVDIKKILEEIKKWRNDIENRVINEVNEVEEILVRNLKEELKKEKITEIVSEWEWEKRYVTIDFLTKRIIKSDCFLKFSKKLIVTKQFLSLECNADYNFLISFLLNKLLIFIKNWYINSNSKEETIKTIENKKKESDLLNSKNYKDYEDIFKDSYTNTVFLFLENLVSFFNTDEERKFPELREIYDTLLFFENNEKELLSKLLVGDDFLLSIIDTKKKVSETIKENVIKLINNIYFEEEIIESIERKRKHREPQRASSEVLSNYFPNYKKTIFFNNYLIKKKRVHKEIIYENEKLENKCRELEEIAKNYVQKSEDIKKRIEELEYLLHCKKEQRKVITESEEERMFLLEKQIETQRNDLKKISKEFKKKEEEKRLLHNKKIELEKELRETLKENNKYLNDYEKLEKEFLKTKKIEKIFNERLIKIRREIWDKFLNSKKDIEKELEIKEEYFKKKEKEDEKKLSKLILKNSQQNEIIERIEGEVIEIKKKNEEMEKTYHKIFSIMEERIIEVRAFFSFSSPSNSTEKKEENEKITLGKEKMDEMFKMKFESIIEEIEQKSLEKYKDCIEEKEKIFKKLAEFEISKELREKEKKHMIIVVIFLIFYVIFTFFSFFEKKKKNLYFSLPRWLTKKFS